MDADLVLVDESEEAVVGAHGIGLDWGEGFCGFTDHRVGDLEVGLSGFGGGAASGVAAGVEMAGVLHDRDRKDFFVERAAG